MNQPTTRPGIRTTEFLLALGVTVLGAVAAIYAESPAAQVAGMVGAALASAGYGLARSQVKRTGAVVEAQAAERADVMAEKAAERLTISVKNR